MPILSVVNLRKRYGDTIAVDGLSFVVAPGEIVGLLGPNGAGKTTTINMILAVLEPSAGTINIDGHDLATERREALSRTNFAAVYAPLPGNLTVEQNLRVFGMLYGVRALGSRIDTLLDRFDLARFRRVKCGVLSSGEQTRVGLAKAMLNAPRLLLLDEPTASLDPGQRRRLWANVDRVREGGGAVVFATQNLDEVERHADRVAVLRAGELVFAGSPARYEREFAEDVFA